MSRMLKQHSEVFPDLQRSESVESFEYHYIGILNSGKRTLRV
jgi:hypothetical protein